MAELFGCFLWDKGLAAMGRGRRGGGQGRPSSILEGAGGARTPPRWGEGIRRRERSCVLESRPTSFADGLEAWEDRKRASSRALPGLWPEHLGARGSPAPPRLGEEPRWGVGGNSRVCSGSLKSFGGGGTGRQLYIPHPSPFSFGGRGREHPRTPNFSPGPTPGRWGCGTDWQGERNAWRPPLTTMGRGPLLCRVEPLCPCLPVSLQIFQLPGCRPCAGGETEAQEAW